MFNLQYSINLCTFAHTIVMIASYSLGLLVIKVKIMLLDFQTAVMLGCVVIATILCIVTLIHTNIR